MKPLKGETGYAEWSHRMMVFCQDEPGLAEILKALIKAEPGEMTETDIARVTDNVQKEFPKMTAPNILNKELHGLLTTATE